MKNHYYIEMTDTFGGDGKPDVNASLWGIKDGLPDMVEYHEEMILELINECLSQITATIGD